MAFEDLAPGIRIEVEGNEVFASTSSVETAVVRCEVDLTRDIADQIRLTIANPFLDALGEGYSTEYAFLDSKAFEPGNRIDVFMGYGGELDHVGSGIIEKWLPVFPQAGVPTLTIIARDASILLMDGQFSHEPEEFIDLPDEEIAAQIVLNAGILTVDFEEAGVTNKKRVKKLGMTDYQFVKGLANLHGFEFKVRYDIGVGSWVAVFRTPKSEQDQVFTFTYNDDFGTLLSFQPEWGFRNAPTEVKILFFNKSTAEWDELIVGGNEEGESPFFSGGADERVEEPGTSLSRLRIAAAGKSVEVIGNRNFQTTEEAELWARSWFDRRKDNFITGRGRAIGVTELKPGDVHNFTNIGVRLGGEWEFTTVKHVFDAIEGYYSDFFVHKLITS